MPATVVVTFDADAPDGAAAAARVAAEADLSVGADGDLLLVITTRGLELREPGDRPGTGLRVDFRALAAEAARGVSRRQPLGRAMGRGSRTVLDATAGLGQDAVLLALMGFDVHAVERSPVVAALLRDGLARSATEPRLGPALADRLRVTCADARDVLRSGGDVPDVVYLDPMYPPKRKASALARRAIRLVRRLVGDDPDAADLLATARAAGAGRVVVKRPQDAPPLAGTPSGAITGTLVRYDVYGRTSGDAGA